MTTTKDDEILDRRKEVWSRRVRGETVREIAEALGRGVATIQSDLNAVREELEEGNLHKAEVERAVGASRLDKAARSLLSAIDIAASPSELSTIANGLARIEERRAKLLGLDAASRTELTGADGGPLKVEDAKNALLAKLSGLAASEPAEGEAVETDSETDA